MTGARNPSLEADRSLAPLKSPRFKHVFPTHIEVNRPCRRDASIAGVEGRDRGHLGASSRFDRSISPPEVASDKRGAAKTNALNRVKLSLWSNSAAAVTNQSARREQQHFSARHSKSASPPPPEATLRGCISLGEQFNCPFDLQPVKLLCVSKESAEAEDCALIHAFVTFVDADLTSWSPVAGSEQGYCARKACLLVSHELVRICMKRSSSEEGGDFIGALESNKQGGLLYGDYVGKSCTLRNSHAHSHAVYERSQTNKIWALRSSLLVLQF